MENGLYREEAMKEITSPEELDQVIKITDRKTNILVLGIILIIITCIIWGYFGSLPVTISGSGIIMPEGGVHHILPGQEGILKSILVSQGQYLHEGEVVGTLELDDGTIIDIISKMNCRVSEIRSLVGDFILSEEKLISVVEATEDKEVLEAIMFVPVEQGKNLTRGLDVHIQPSNVNKEEYGFIKGVVMQVSEYPVSQQRLLALLGTEALVSRFSEGQVVLEVEVDFILSDSTVSGYEWSTPEGPPFKIYEGTLCNASFIIETRNPMEFVLYGR